MQYTELYFLKYILAIYPESDKLLLHVERYPGYFPSRQHLVSQ
jgi:hypothetical protein